MKRRFSLLLALLFGTATPYPALCWNGLGHMEVAAIAWEELTPTAKVAAGKFLRLNPLYTSWIDNVAPAEHDHIAFIKSAKWADIIKRLSAPDCKWHSALTYLFDSVTS